jgi:hypothetical protein
MKMDKRIIYLALATILLGAVLSKNKHHSNKHHQSGYKYEGVELKNAQAMDTTPKHINDIVIGNPNTISRDRSPLWKTFKNNKFEKPFMHGIVGPQWTPPIAEENNGFKHIASPMPRPELVTRIQPNEFAPVTYSPSAFDVPLRKDVIQADIPQATIRTVEERLDPRNPPKRLVPVVHGTLFHGTGSVDAKVVQGGDAVETTATNFIQKNHKHKKGKKHHRSHHNVDVQALRGEAVKIARATDERSDYMMDKISHNIAGENHMVIPVEVMNKRDTLDLKLHENNRALKRNLERLRHTPAGVRAANTLRKLP